MRVSPARKVVSLASRRGLTAGSPLWACPTRVELVSAAVDTDVIGIGSTPFLGDFSQTGIRVPASPTTDQSHRYLFRLCGAEVPSGAGLVIRGVRQLVTVRAEYPIENGDVAAGTFPFEREVTSPLWHFTDGDVSFHLRWQRQVQGLRYAPDLLQVAGTSPSSFGVDTALLYDASTGLGPFGGPYVPLGAGIPPGLAADFLGTIRDVRYPWSNTDWSLSVPVQGPGVLVLYASVYQTNPATRIKPPQLVPPAPFTEPVLCGMRPEDQFLIQHPTCNYGRVAGALLLDLFPCCGDVSDPENTNDR